MPRHASKLEKTRLTLEAIDDVVRLVVRAPSGERRAIAWGNEHSLLATFADPNDPDTMRTVLPDKLEAVFGSGVHFRGVTAEVVPNGYWPIDFGGPLGEPVTRGIEAKLPWLKGTDDGAATALKAADIRSAEPIDAPRYR